MTPALRELIERIDELYAKATQCESVEVSWYPLLDGSRHPQFETERGGIAQEEADYELYCELRNAWPALKSALSQEREIPPLAAEVRTAPSYEGVGQKGRPNAARHDGQAPAAAPSKEGHAAGHAVAAPREPTDEILWAICENSEARMDFGCRKCPSLVMTSEGEGTQGCRLIAEQIYIACEGRSLFRACARKKPR